MNVFDNADIANYQDAVAKASQANLTQQQKIDKRQEEENKQTENYNETLRGILDPIGGEILRQPLEGLVHDTIKKGIKKLTGKATEEVAKVAKAGAKRLSERLGVTDDQIARASRELGKPREPPLSELKLPKSTLPAKLDNDTAKLLNRSRLVRGKAPKINTTPTEEVDGEPRLVSAFDDKPIVPKPFKAPLFEEASGDDWVDKLYNSPVNATSKTVENARARVPTEAPPAEEPRGITPSLEKIFKQPETQEAVDFKFKRPIQPKTEPDLSGLPSVEELTAAKAEPQVLDQLAPMRELAQQQAEARNASIIDTAKPVPKPQPVEPPKPQAPKSTDEPSAGQSIEKQAEKEASQPLEKTGLETGAEEGLEGTEIALESDPLTAGIGLILGLGTLIGGELGGKKAEPIEQVQAKLNPSTTYGI
jgi:hypothetical protein